MDDNEDYKFAVPQKITLPFFLSIFKANSNAWLDVLKAHKVSVFEIEKIQGEVLAKMKPSIIRFNKECCDAVTKYHNKVEFEERRADFLGRAIIELEFAKFFPNDSKKKDLLKKQGIQGFLPHQISTPIIDFIKLTTGASTTEEYADVCRKIAHGCRNKEDRLIDWGAYFTHKRVKMILDKLFERFRKIFSGRDSDRRREWLVERISEAESIMKMGRNITDDEYDLMERILLGK